MKNILVLFVFAATIVPAFCQGPELDFDGKINREKLSIKDAIQFHTTQDSIYSQNPVPQQMGTMEVKKSRVSENGIDADVTPIIDPETNKAYYTFKPLDNLDWTAKCTSQNGGTYSVCATYKFSVNYGGHSHAKNVPGYAWTANTSQTVPTTSCANNVPVNTQVIWHVTAPAFATRSEESLKFSGTCNGSYSDIVDLKTEGLVALPPASADSLHSGVTYYALIGATTEHPINHYAKSQTIDLLKQIAWQYYFETSKPISINDISLKWGGLFDVDKDASGNLIPWVPPHHEHRFGRQADVRRNDMTDAQQARFTEIACDNGVSILLEKSTGEIVPIRTLEDLFGTSAAAAPHFHLRFPKYDTDADNPPDVLPEGCPPSLLQSISEYKFKI